LTTQALTRPVDIVDSGTAELKLIRFIFRRSETFEAYTLQLTIHACADLGVEVAEHLEGMLR
jgi:hypothetical protein